MDIVISIDSFKGCMSSMDSGKVLQQAIHDVYPEDHVQVFPLADGGEGTERIHRIFEGTQIVTDNAFLLTRCADYKDEHNVMYVPMDVPEEITPLCWLPFFQMTACRLTDDLDRWNKHPLQRAMEKFVSSKSANYVNSPFSEDTPGRG